MRSTEVPPHRLRRPGAGTEGVTPMQRKSMRLVRPLTAKQAARFWPKVDKNGPVPAARPELGPCWLWTAALWGGGYGAFGIRVGGKSRTHNAHRLSYGMLVGPIPHGLVLDHLCRVRHCVNPAHLDPVTDRINILRGASPFAKKARQFVCLAGHPFDEANTYVNRNGTRHCHACRDVRRHAAYPVTFCACGCGQQTKTGVRYLRGHNLTRRGRSTHGYTEPARSRPGERNPKAKLTESDVIDMRLARSRGEPLALLAERYGVATQTVSKICRRGSWCHVQGLEPTHAA